jgi:hypothetical protein
MARTLQPLLIGLLCLGAPACAGAVKNMRAVESVNTAVAPNEAMVIFLRPSGMGFGVQSSVFEVADNRPATLVGIVAAKKKLAYRTTPGLHTFMIIGESADFMYADLQPGRTYHAIAQVRMGVWKARFSLQPVHAYDRGQLPGYLADSSWVETGPESLQWAQENSADIEGKRAEYYLKWMQKPAAERPALFPQDGE